MNIKLLPQISNMQFKPVTFRASSNINVKLKDQPSSDTFEKTPKKEIQNAPALERGQMLNSDGTIFNRRTTSMFRDDLEWKDFGKYLKNRFSNADKINTYVYACAAGAEAYTLSITLQNALKDKAKKFFPIIAKDINKDLIDMNIALQSQCTKHTDSYNLIRRSLGLDSKQILEFVVPDKNLSAIGLGIFTDKVTEPVQFECANILEDLDSIDSNNPSIVMCRNMWPYVNPDEYSEFAQNLYEKLAPGSIVVIGEYDYFGEPGRENSNTFSRWLFEAGFEQMQDSESFLLQGSGLIFEKN